MDLNGEPHEVIESLAARCGDAFEVGGAAARSVQAGGAPATAAAACLAAAYGPCTAVARHRLLPLGLLVVHVVVKLPNPGWLASPLNPSRFPTALTALQR